MQNAKCKMQNAKCKMQNAKCKMQNAKCKMQNIYAIINNPINTNKRIIGRKIMSHDKPECPSLQIKLRTYVQKRIYTN